MSELDLVPDQHALARVGAIVRERLAGDPGIYKVENPLAELFAVGDFLSPAECEKLITMIDEVARPSSLHELEYASGFRTS